MKKSLLLFLSFLFLTSLSQAMDNETWGIQPHTQPKLNKPFISAENIFGKYIFGKYKTLPLEYVETYNERSKLYSLAGACYPKIPIFHPYAHSIMRPPFGAVFLGSDVTTPLPLQKYHPSGKDEFFFLNIQTYGFNETPFSLKPHYAVFPSALAIDEKDQVADVMWTVVPGAVGEIIPKNGTINQELLKETISIHGKGANDRELILSGDVMHLQGIDTQKSMDCYSFIDTDKCTLLTYHWVLTLNDFEKFNQALGFSNTLNELVHNLGVWKFQPDLLKELKTYVKYNENK